jgi:hypothetical protein
VEFVLQFFTSPQGYTSRGKTVEVPSCLFLNNRNLLAVRLQQVQMPTFG